MQITAAKARPATTSLPDASTDPARPAAWERRSGLILKELLALFLLVDGGARVAGFGPYVEGTLQAGYPASYGPGIGLTLVAATVLYLIPRTAIPGGILLTGYLGAAVATNLRLQASFLFPLIFGVLVWVALYLLDPRLRELVAPRR